MTNQCPPNYAYYSTAHGHWASPFELRIKDFKLFWKNVDSWLDRLRLISFVLASKTLGPFVLETEVHCPSADLQPRVVTHRTRLKKWGILAYEAEERFHLDNNGRDFMIEGWERLLPWFWSKSPLPSGQGQIAETGRHASYQFRWFGEAWRLENEILPNRVRVNMDCAWASGTQRLERTGNPGLG